MKNITKSKDITTKNLKLTDVVKLANDPNIKDMLNEIDVIQLQNMMEELIHGESLTPCNGEQLYNSSREYMYAKDCLDSEHQEILQLLPWKSWKLEKYKKMNFEDIIEMLDKSGGEMSMEVADTIFFMSVMFIKMFEILRLPISDNTKKILYLIKFRENIERINSGTFDKARELTKSEKQILNNIDKILGK